MYLVHAKIMPAEVSIVFRPANKDCADKPDRFPRMILIHDSMVQIGCGNFNGLVLNIPNDSQPQGLLNRNIPNQSEELREIFHRLPIRLL